MTAARYDLCRGCGETIRYQPRKRGSQVICNVYEDGVWNRVEHWHDACYDETELHGPAVS